MGGLTNFLSKLITRGIWHDIQGFQSYCSGLGQNKSTFLGRQWEGGGFWVPQPDTLCLLAALFQFFIHHGHFLVSLVSKDTPGLAPIYEPHVLFSHFYP
ncbi:hypothetical protein FJTKL_13544 [Diaporthe vaccinii]|uniref:Uncharacterized protein n=1 Tax=Diaporthe vaccinii TaxID=105482 RepID=A0ABR4EAB1_9PEZI